MKRLLIAALLLLFALPVEGRVLVIYGEPSSSDVISETNVTNKAFGKYRDYLGFDYDVVSAKDTTLVRTKAQSGDYTCAVFLNLPEFDAALRSNAEVLAAGCGLLGVWIGPSDVLMPLPIIVPLPGEAFSTAAAQSIFSDSCGVDVTSTDSVSVTYQQFTNANGDTLRLSAHAHDVSPIAFLDLDNQTHVTALTWMSDSRESLTYTASNWWKYDKDNGHPVYIIQHCGSSMSGAPFATTLGFHERCTPMDVVLIADEYPWWNVSSPDTTGQSTNAWSFANFCINNSFKVEMAVMEPYHDSFPGRNSMTLITANTNIFHITPNTRHRIFTANELTGYDWLGYRQTQNSSERRTNIGIAQDSIAADYYMSGMDLTWVMAYIGMYGYRSGQPKFGQELLGDMHSTGIRNIVSWGNNMTAQWPHSISSTDGMYQYTNSMRFWVGTDEMQIYAINNEDLYGLTKTKIAPNALTGSQNNMLWRIMGCWWNPGTDASAVNAAICLRISDNPSKVSLYGQYAPGFRIDSDTFTDCASAYSNGDACNAVFIAGMVNDQINFYNSVAATCTATGVVPLRSCHLADVNYGRRTGKPFPNSHVTVK